jgi:hypothetical protein
MAFLNVLRGLSHFILAIPVFNFAKTRLGFRSLRPCWKGFFTILQWPGQADDSRGKAK